MPASRATFTFLLVVALVCAAPSLLARKKEKIPSNASTQRQAAHALNRLTFGPQPGDLQKVMAVGVDQWIDQQLHPEKINDDALESRLDPLRTTRMSSKDLAENFPDGQEINQVMNGKRPMPSDPALRMIYRVQIARQQDKKDRAQEAIKAATAAPQSADVASSGNAAKAEGATANNSASTTGDGSMAMNSADGEKSVDKIDDKGEAAVASAKMTPEEEQSRRREEQLYADLDAQKKAQEDARQALERLPNFPPDQRFKQILALPEESQLALADSMKGGKNREVLEGLGPRQKEVLQALNGPGNVVTGELTQAKLLRAIYSERQLEEVMTDFWFNHFNVFVDKGVDRFLITSYERDVIRPHAFGKFEDLLVATAKSPAMLFYLDNWLSVGPSSAQALGIPAHPNGPYRRPFPPRPGNKNKRTSGLNENYGRELMELHTLSVNGGYSQRDVTEVAKVFTGWTIDKPYQGGGFRFDPRMHEPGPKFVLGRKIKFKGEGEGLEVLHRLAKSPQTAHFISLKLAQRFVSDDPPPALVERMAKTFLKKKGDIREVLTVLFHSPEFWDDSNYRAKVKTPLEFVASAVRASGAEVEDAQPLARQLNNMGMPLYGAQPPTGYSMKAENWVSSSALLNRMNFALALTGGKIKGVKVDASALAGGNLPNSPPEPSVALAALEADLLGGDVSKQTNDSIRAQIDPAVANTAQKTAKKSKPPDIGTIAGLLLGSPEFQRR